MGGGNVIDFFHVSHHLGQFGGELFFVVKLLFSWMGGPPPPSDRGKFHDILYKNSPEPFNHLDCQSLIYKVEMWNYMASAFCLLSLLCNSAIPAVLTAIQKF